MCERGNNDTAKERQLSDTEQDGKISERIERLEQDVRGLRKRTEPDQIAKAIDNSFLSIHNLRGFLQILTFSLSIIFTVFLAGLGVVTWFSYNSYSNMLFEMLSRVKQVETTYESVIETYAAVTNKKAELDATVIAAQTRSETQLKIFNTERQQGLQELRASISNGESQIQGLVKTYYEAMTVDKLEWSDENRLQFSRKEDGALVVFFVLSQTPILQTVRVQYGTELLIPDSYVSAKNNVLHCTFSKDIKVKDLKNNNMYISYVPDPSKKGSVSRLSRDGEKIYVDGVCYTNVRRVTD